MSDDLDFFGLPARPDPDRPLRGMTVLVVEDSRFASEAVRLLCLRSGARIRRADTLAAAHRHLRVYRPTIVIVDLGLPDGSGAGLIRDLALAQPRVAVVLGTSGDAAMSEIAIGAGADGFLAKPIESLALFQQAVLSRLPSAMVPDRPRVLPMDRIEPDRLALIDDLEHMAEVLRDRPDGAMQDYIAQFLGGVARSARDGDLEAAATSLATARALGRGTGSDLARVADMLQDRLFETRAV